MENIFSYPFQMKKEKSLDVHLAKLAIKGDSEAYTELLQHHSVYLYKLAYSYVKNEQQALDIIQETTYKGFIHIKKLQNPTYFKTWISRILINEAMDLMKKENQLVSLDNVGVMSEKEKSVCIETKLDLYDAMDLLRPDYKTVIILKFFNDLSVDEIAKLMDISSNTVKSHLRRAKAQLKELLTEEFKDE